MRSWIPLMALVAALACSGCGEGKAPPPAGSSTPDAPQALTEKQREELKEKFEAEAKKDVTADNAADVLKKMEDDLKAEGE